MDLVSAFIEKHLVAAGDNRRQRKILVVRHRRRNNAGIIKPFAFGLPFVFELLPRVPAAPVLLGVKQRNQRGETRKAEKKPLQVAPAKKTADEGPKANKRGGDHHADQEREN